MFAQEDLSPSSVSPYRHCEGHHCLSKVQTLPPTCLRYTLLMLLATTSGKGHDRGLDAGIIEIVRSLTTMKNDSETQDGV